MSSLLKEGVARRGCAERWSWQRGQRPAGAPLPFFFAGGSRARELVAGKFTRVGPDRGGGQLKAPRGQRAGPWESRLPPSGLEPRLRDVPTGSTEWSGVTDCDTASAQALGLEKIFPAPDAPTHSLPTCLDSFHEDVSCGISFKSRESQSETLEPHNQPPPARVCHHCLRNSYDPKFIG